MRVSVVINNYNYARYLPEAIRSVFAQTRAPDEIVLVDDGSTDGSIEKLEQECDTTRIKIVRKANGGQLSAFNAGYQAATGDVLFFLDSDDMYFPGYIEKALGFLSSNPGCDFLATGYRKFGSEEKICLKYPVNTDLGYSIILALYGKRLLGGPTSTLCIKKRILDLFMPIPLEAAWRTRADDCLGYGSSIAGAHMFYLAEPLVGYRIHDTNLFQGSQATSANGRIRRFKHRIQVNRLMGYVARRMEYFLPTLILNITNEYLSAAHGRRSRDYWHYLKAVWRSGKSLSWKLTCTVVLSLLKWGGDLRRSWTKP